MNTLVYIIMVVLVHGDGDFGWFLFVPVVFASLLFKMLRLWAAVL